MRYSLRVFIGVMLLLVASVAVQAQQRPHDPWVLRTTLDGRTHILVAALHNNLWVTYDVSRPAVFKILDGDVNFTGGPMYTWAHGPMPTSRGRVLASELDASEWWLFQAGNLSEANVTFRGHRFIEGGAEFELVYHVTLGDQVIEVTESPRAVVEGGKANLLRIITIHGDLPEGAFLVLALPNGSFSVESDGQVADRMVILNQDTTDVKLIF